MVRNQHMTYYWIKILVTTALVIIISEVAKRSTLVGAILASVPLISVLAMIWLYIDTRDVDRVSELATSVFWLVLPSLALFISLPILLQQGVNFYLSMLISIVLTIVCYFIMLHLLSRFGITV